ncbi:MAG: ferrous iron transport protein A [Labilithrix sp.]|nr:ferrous iron transport protein A [Labilithrix sp.]MCW5831250.1 ferrous iron transport protein A [Labilithrix sp.]
MVVEAKRSIDAAAAPSGGPLATATSGARVRVVAVRLDADVAAWLAAVGLHVGEEVVVLRRAVLGGPLHVRTSSGGEFAVARELAEKLDVVAAREAES